MNTNEKNPAALAGAVRVRADHLEADAPENNPFPTDLQRLRLTWVARRFPLSASMAGLLADLAFLTAEARQ